jgi:hypothetical protein
MRMLIAAVGLLGSGRRLLYITYPAAFWWFNQLVCSDRQERSVLVERKRRPTQAVADVDL